MERLTIKELAPYVEHDIKGLLTPQKEVVALTGIFVDKFGLHEVQINYNGCYALSRFKPLLRPISSLTEEIEHNGKRFVPIDKLELEGYVIGYNGFSITIGQEEGYSFGYAIDVYNQIIQKLHEWHFDTANLLGRGLALPIDGKEVEG